VRPGPKREFDTFLGVDLGGGKGKKTAVARLERFDGHVRVVHVGTRSPTDRPYFDDDLIAYLLDHEDRALLAIDAPLSTSVCLRCRLAVCPGLARCEDPVVVWFREEGERLFAASPRSSSRKPSTTPYTQRACEILLHKRFGIWPRETLGQGMGPLTARAHYLRRALAPRFVLHENLIEVYPKATVHALFGERRSRAYKREVDTWSTRAAILEGLESDLRFDIWREGCLQNDHCFDAVLCAYTGYLWARDAWSLPESDRAVLEEDGWIWFPPLRDKEEVDR
jgi:predicted RNase H-like nuclease